VLLIRELEYLTDARNVLECQVRLPDGKQIFTAKEGMVVLSETLKLNNVLYVSNLKCNLISVSHLIDEFNCMAQFTDKFCVIKDHDSRMVIGTGEQRGGVYYLQGMDYVIAATIKSGNDFNLWHRNNGVELFVRL